MSSTGQALGYVVGAVAGYLTGGASYVLMGAAIGGAVGAALDPPKGPNLQGPRLSDLSQQGASYGTAIPRIYGTVATHGNIFWIENNSLRETSKTESSGGKGGGGGSETTTYQYSATFALGLCQGPIAGIRRIWINGDLIYNVGADDIETILASNASASGFTLHLGTDTQAPDARMQATLGVANTPAYRGLAYLVFHDLALEKYGNTLAGAQIKVEVVDHADFPVPTLHGLLSYVGTVVAAEDGYFQTAEVNPGRFDLAAGLYHGSCTFRDYRYDGTLISIHTLEHPVAKSSGNDSLAFHKACFIYGKPNCFFACCTDEYRISIYPDEKSLQLDATALMSVSSPHSYSYAGGYYWFPSATVGTRISRDLESYVTFTITDASHQSLNVREDKATGRIFVRYHLESSGAAIFSEFSGLPDSPLWQESFGDGLAYGSAGYNHFSVYANRLLVSNTAYAFEFPTGRLTLYDILPGGLSKVSELSNLGAVINVYSLDNGFAISGGYLYRLTEDINTHLASLGDIVLRETLQAGTLDTGDIDVSDLTDNVRGYRVSTVGAIRAAIEPLQGCFPFDVLQSGYQIKYRRRGLAASVASVSQSDLGARRGDEKPVKMLTSTREMDSQLPVRVSLKFIDADREYDVGEQYAERLNTDSVNVQSTEIPVVLTASEALQTAEVLLYMYWLERHEFSFTLPPSFRQLEPADVVSLTVNDNIFTLRLTRIQYLADGRLECSARLNDASTYTSSAIGADGVTSPGTIAFGGKTVYELLDIPSLIDTGGTYGFAVAMAGYSDNWVSGVLYRSADAGSSWTDTNAFAQPSVIGQVKTLLVAPADSRMMDKASTLGVVFYSGQTLSSVTESALLNGMNHFAYGRHGRWEIIAAQTATLQTDGSYVLTDLLRGRYGTEWAMGNHTLSDRLVLLSQATLQWCASSINALDIPMNYRGISKGAAMDSDTSRSFAYRGINLKCLAPVWLIASRPPTTNNWQLAWTRRTRQGGEWRDSVDVLLGESAEAYEIDIFSSGSFTTVKRTISGLTSPEGTYTSAQQYADFGMNQETIHIKVYQLSAIGGRGYPLTETISRWG